MHNCIFSLYRFLNLQDEKKTSTSNGQLVNQAVVTPYPRFVTRPVHQGNRYHCVAP